MRRALLIACAALAAALGPGGPRALAGAPAVTASVSPDTATVGDRLTLTLTAVHDAGTTAVFPDVENAVAPFEVISSAVVPPVESDGRVTDRRDYVVAAFETGALAVPALPFLFVSAAGETVAASTDSVVVTVESVLPDTAGGGGQVEPRDIRPPVSLPREIWPFVVAAAALAAGYAAYRYLRRWWLRRKAAPVGPLPVPAVPPEAAHVAAFERLSALEREDLPSRGEFARFYDGLSDILRLYVGDRFAVQAIDMTTSEVPAAMAAARIGAADVEWMADFLEHADLAKFAKFAPTVERAREDGAAAREFVERTRFRGEAPAAPGDAGAAAGGAGTAGGGEGGAC